MSLKKAIAAGIGLFLAFIAFWDAKLVHDPGADFDPSLSSAAAAIITSGPSVIFFGILLGAILLVKKVHGALLITIAVHRSRLHREAIELIRQPAGWSLVVPSFDGQDVGPVLHFSLLQVHLFGAFSLAQRSSPSLLIVFSLLVVDFFDTMGTMTAVGEEAELNDEQGIPENSQEILIVDSVSAMAGGVASRVVQHGLHRVGVRRR